MANKTIGGLTVVDVGDLGANAVIEVEDQDLTAPKSRQLLLSSLGGAAINTTNGVVPMRQDATSFTDSPLSVSGAEVTFGGDLVGFDGGIGSYRFFFDYSEGKLAVRRPATSAGASFETYDEDTGATVGIYPWGIYSQPVGGITDFQIMMGGNHSFSVVFDNATQGIAVDRSTTAGQTRLFVWDVDAGTLRRVTVGAADSGGTGYKVLRIPN